MNQVEAGIDTFYDEKKTSQQWYDLRYPDKSIVILDPDGWDRSNWDFSWGQELITELEFWKRLSLSTVRIKPQSHEPAPDSHSRYLRKETH